MTTMSFFSSKSNHEFTSPIDHVLLDNPEAPLFGPLEASDLFWTCAGLFASPQAAAGLKSVPCTQAAS